jgi:eukaryotic-like serine/threonine-protein kinase
MACDSPRVSLWGCYPAEVGTGAMVRMPQGLLVDARIAGRFRVVRHLGAGGMGDVYKAVDERDGGHVALKVLSGRARDSAVATERLLREGAAGARIRHPGVVRVLDVGLDDGRPYLAMELLEGEDLGTRLERQGPLSIQQVAELSRELCEALVALHAAGVVHRDLKPRNLFLARDATGTERLKVLDFGLAKAAFLGDSLTEAEQVFGTLLYLSPEQLRGARYADARSDVWAAGTILYEALTGRAAFSGDSAPEVMQQITCAAPPRVETLRPEVPRVLSLLVWRAMQSDPALRFQSAEAMRAAIEPSGRHGGALPLPDALTQSFTDVLPMTQAEPPPARRHRQGSIATLAVPCAVVLVQVVVLLHAAAGAQGGGSVAPTPRAIRAVVAAPSGPPAHVEAPQALAGPHATARDEERVAASDPGGQQVAPAAATSPPSSSPPSRPRRAPRTQPDAQEPALLGRAPTVQPAARVVGSAGEIKRSEF